MVMIPNEPSVPYLDFIFALVHCFLNSAFGIAILVTSVEISKLSQVPGVPDTPNLVSVSGPKLIVPDDVDELLANQKELRQIAATSRPVTGKSLSRLKILTPQESDD